MKGQYRWAFSFLKKNCLKGPTEMKSDMGKTVPPWVKGGDIQVPKSHIMKQCVFLSLLTKSLGYPKDTLCEEHKAKSSLTLPLPQCIRDQPGDNHSYSQLRGNNSLMTCLLSKWEGIKNTECFGENETLDVRSYLNQSPQRTPNIIN